MRDKRRLGIRLSRVCCYSNEKLTDLCLSFGNIINSGSPQKKVASFPGFLPIFFQIKSSFKFWYDDGCATETFLKLESRGIKHMFCSHLKNSPSLSQFCWKWIEHVFFSLSCLQWGGKENTVSGVQGPGFHAKTSWPLSSVPVDH